MAYMQEGEIPTTRETKRQALFEIAQRFREAQDASEIERLGDQLWSLIFAEHAN